MLESGVAQDGWCPIPSEDKLALIGLVPLKCNVLPRPTALGAGTQEWVSDVEPAFLLEMVFSFQRWRYGVPMSPTQGQTASYYYFIHMGLTKSLFKMVCFHFYRLNHIHSKILKTTQGSDLWQVTSMQTYPQSPHSLFQELMLSVSCTSFQRWSGQAFSGGFHKRTRSQCPLSSVVCKELTSLLYIPTVPGLHHPWASWALVPHAIFSVLWLDPDPQLLNSTNYSIPFFFSYVIRELTYCEFVESCLFVATVWHPLHACKQIIDLFLLMGMEVVSNLWPLFTILQCTFSCTYVRAPVRNSWRNRTLLICVRTGPIAKA